MDLKKTMASGTCSNDVLMDIGKLANKIGARAEAVVLEIFQAHGKELLNRPASHIIASVWGVMEGGKLDETQKQIHRECAPVIDDIVRSLWIDSLQPDQVFAIQYLVRGYMISRLLWIIEHSRRLIADGCASSKENAVTLLSLEPQGRA
ncbi:MAG: hypothetical protein JW884_09275 [Deltaproteobacteria bacterium]|nr:hypothetical protein [Deltaproteobacteria bacterium]